MKYRTLIIFFFFCLFLDILTFLWTSIHYSLSLFLRTFVSFSYSFFPLHFLFLFPYRSSFLPFLPFPRHTLSRQCHVTRVSTVIFSTHTRAHQEIYIPLGYILSCEPLPGIPLESRADYPPPTFSSSFFTTTYPFALVYLSCGTGKSCFFIFHFTVYIRYNVSRERTFVEFHEQNRKIH